jgi:amidase
VGEFGWPSGIDRLRKAGVAIVDANIPTQGQWSTDEFEVLLNEFAPGLERYLRDFDAPLDKLAAVIDFNQRNAERVMPWFGQQLLEQAQARPGLDAEPYLAARERARRRAGPEGIDAALKNSGVDLLIAPTTGPAWSIDLVNGDRVLGSGYSVAAVAGYPSLTIPTGKVHDLPVGFVLIGPAWSEAKLLEVADRYEDLRGPLSGPKYLPSITP